MKKTTIPLIIFLIVALVGGLMLVNQNQETRKGATFASTKLMVLPSEKIIKNVGDIVSVKVWYQTESEAKVDGVQTVLCYGNELSLNEDTGVVANTDNGFESEPIVSIKDSSSGKCVTIVATSKKAADKLKTTGEAFTVNFTAAAVGEGDLTLDKTKSMVTGDNAASATDKEIAITSVEDTTYQIGGGATGDEPVLNYRVSFGSVKKADGKCAVNWPLQIIVLSGGVTKVYTNVKPALVTSTGELNVYEGSLPLVGFDKLTNVAAFIKGPKHLQRKYAVQNQTKLYDKAGGELTLTKSASTSPKYDFTGFPMLPGDIVGDTVTSAPNGEINGVDFAYLKSQPSAEAIADGGYIKGDLDGNCQINSIDTAILKVSLQTKQGELY